MAWKDSNEETPETDGRYAVIVENLGYVRRTFEDYSTTDGWLTGMSNATVIAWDHFAGIPDWVIEKYNQEAA